MTRRIKTRRERAAQRRNPIARALRDAAFRARKEQNRRRYSRKAKHKPAVETDREYGNAMPLRLPLPDPRLLACLGLALTLAGCGYLLPRAAPVAPAALPAGAYRTDPEHATLLFKVDHLGFSELVGRFDRFDASLNFDPKQPEAARLTVLIDTASIDLNLPKFERDLRGPDWFDVARFPQARFESRKIVITGAKTGGVTGDLTLHGVTAPVTLDVTFNGAGDSLITGRYTLGFAASGTLKRSTFGLGAYAPAVGDQVTLEIHTEFERTGAGAPSG